MTSKSTKLDPQDIKLQCYFMAKDSKDKDWDDLVKYRNLWREARQKILKKYRKEAIKILKGEQNG